MAPSSHRAVTKYHQVTSKLPCGEGMLVGDPVGSILGWEEGCREGWDVGRLEGCRDGWCVGDDVDCVDGWLVGCDEGMLIG